MNKEVFSLIIAGASLLLAGCTVPQVAQQAPLKPLYGPGSDPVMRPIYGAEGMSAPTYPRNPSPAYRQVAAPAYPPPPKWQPQAVAPAPRTAGYQSGAAAWQVIGAPRSQSLGQGAMLHECKARSITGTADVTVVVFDSRQCTLRVIDQPTPNAGGGVMNQLMRSHQAIAGVNGGYFHSNFQPLGAFIANGRKTGNSAANKLLSGSVLVIGREPYLIWNAEFLGEKGVTDLIQCGPRLVDNSIPIAGLSREKNVSRTFIATDGKRTWAIGTVRSTSLAGMAELLAESTVIPGLHVTRALNLDGGHSTAIWARPIIGREISQSGWSTVRNYLAVVPR